jgi:hypothetical protein
MNIQAYLLSQGISVSEQTAARLAKGLARIAPKQEELETPGSASVESAAWDFLDKLETLSDE